VHVELLCPMFSLHKAHTAQLPSPEDATLLLSKKKRQYAHEMLKGEAVIVGARVRWLRERWERPSAPVGAKHHHSELGVDVGHASAHCHPSQEVTPFGVLGIEHQNGFLDDGLDLDHHDVA
jgi:hypothetical protein